MRQIVCDKCGKVSVEEFRYDVEIVYAGHIKCRLDLCVECCNGYGIEPAAFKKIPVDAGLKLLEDLKEYIRGE